MNYLIKDNIRYNDNYNPLSNRESKFDTNQTVPFKQETPISLVAEPSITYTRCEHYINISSTNRDTTNYPLHYDYRVDFDIIYKNVKKIELVNAIIPNRPSASSGSTILNEPFLVIDIENLNFIDFPINNTTSTTFKGFSILPLKTPNVGISGTGGYIIPDLGCLYHTSKIYKTPLAKLSYMNIKIRDHTGALYTFNNDNGTTDIDYQHHLVFKITTEEKDQSVLNHRNVF